MLRNSQPTQTELVDWGEERVKLGRQGSGGGSGTSRGQRMNKIKIHCMILSKDKNIFKRLVKAFNTQFFDRRDRFFKKII